MRESLRRDSSEKQPVLRCSSCARAERHELAIALHVGNDVEELQPERSLKGRDCKLETRRAC